MSAAGAVPPAGDIFEAFFEQYRRAFDALDGDAVAALYAEPSGIAQGGVYTHWPAREAVRTNMRALCELYRQRGYVRAEFEPVACVQHSAMHAWADIRWTIHWNTGVAPWRFGTGYNLIRTDEGWRVLLCTAYAEDALHDP